MLLSSIGRSSLERVLAITSSSTSIALQSIKYFQRIPTTICHKDIPAGIISINFTKRQYSNSSRLDAIAKSRSGIPAGKSTRVSKSSVSKVKNKSQKLKQIKRKQTTVLVKKPRKAKKVLSELEKKIVKTISLKSKALRTPKKLPSSARTVYMAVNLKGTSGGEITSKFAEVSKGWKNISQSARERFEILAKANRVANDNKLKEWLSQYTPEQIRIANNARKQITKMGELKRYWKKIPDERLPKHPTSRFLCFVQERFNSGDFKGVDILEASKQLATEYFALSPTEHKKYQDMFIQSRNKYIKDYVAAFNREPKRVKKDLN
ncbi:hypothetical protein HI914_01830 [Erysiphe necator]|nr:hypothetical protein HI914_01830 [Erysiphe necator]